jgi:corrinoid protein of di/trimethylamine methyltransferase
MAEFKDLYEAVIGGDREAAAELTRSALAEGAEPQDLLDQGLLPAMDEVGRRFENDEFFIPELLIAARAMKGAMELITPLFPEKGIQLRGRIAIGTVQGDLHDIGKNLVAAMLEGGGFEVIDLGKDVAAHQFIQAVKESEAQVVALSALLTTTMPGMKRVIQDMVEAKLRDRVKIIIGGAPVNQKYADEIGADGYAETASGAVTLAKSLLGA